MSVAPFSSRCYWARLRQATLAVTELYDAMLAPVGLTINQYEMISNLHYLGTCSNAELAEQTGLDRSTITRNVSLLKNKGLAQDTAPRGSRRSQLSLTPAGEELFQRAKCRWKETQASVSAALGPECVAQLDILLPRLEALAPGVHPPIQ